MVRRYFTATLCLSLSLWGPSIYGEDSLSLKTAWSIAREKSLALDVQKHQADLSIALSQKSALWEDPFLELSQGHRKASAQDSQVMTWNLRQRLPTGADRKIEQIAAEGEASVQALKLKEVELTQERDFAFKVYDHKIAEIELHHTQERLERISAIKQYLNRTKSYTAANSLERRLIDLRLRDIEQKKSKLLLEIQISQSYFNKIGVSGNSITAPWIDASKLPSLVPENRTKNSLMTQQLELKKRIANDQKDISLYRPVVDIFVAGMNESGGAEEKDNSIGIGLSLPLSAFSSGKKNALSANLMMAEKSAALAEREADLAMEEARLLSKNLAEMYKVINVEVIKKLESETPTYEASLKRQEISIVQFLDYEDRIHEQVEQFYQNQVKAIQMISMVSSSTGESILNLIEGMK
ncbi:MAG: hypothetical protein ACM3MG_06580 [Bacillota bacterium]